MRRKQGSNLFLSFPSIKILLSLDLIEILTPTVWEVLDGYSLYPNLPHPYIELKILAPPIL